MDTLYKDQDGNVHAVSPIQTPQDDWIQLKPEEIEAHLKPKEPTNEEKAEQLKRDIIELELKQFRSFKAIMSNATEEDEEIYNEIEAEIQAKREEIRGLENGENI
jgi:hypothetical protein